MTIPDDQYRDLLGEDPDPVLTRLIADLEHVHTTDHPGEHHIAAARAWDRWKRTRVTTHERQPAPVVSLSRRRRAHAGRIRTRLVSLAVAALVILSGTLGYLRLAQSTPASAQVILRRAAGALLTPMPGKVLHQTQTVTVTSPSRTDSTTIDQWTQWDARGKIVRQVTTVRNASGALISRSRLIGHTLRTYTAADNTVRSTRLPSILPPVRLPQVPIQLDPKQLLQAAQRHAPHDLHLLPAQMLGGRTADVVGVTGLTLPGVAPPPGARLPHPPRTRLYIDPNTYSLRGVDTIVGTTEMRMRVTVDEMMLHSAVPPGTFALHAPGNARVLSGITVLLGGSPTLHGNPKVGVGVGQVRPVQQHGHRS